MGFVATIRWYIYIYILEQVLYNPQIDAVRGVHIGLLRLLADRCPCEDTCPLLEFLIGHIRLGAFAPLQQGHHMATLRRYTGADDLTGSIIGELDPVEGVFPPSARSYRSPFDQRLDIDIVFMPWWRMVIPCSRCLRCSVEPASQPLSLSSGSISEASPSDHWGWPIEDYEDSEDYEHRMETQNI